MKEQDFCYTCGKSLTSLTEPHECNPLSREEIINAAKEFGRKSLLQILSSPGEGHERVWRYIAADGSEYFSSCRLPIGNEEEFCEVAELLQGMAEVETLRHELKMGHSCALMLASSEARVRSLTAALEWYAKTAKNTVALKALREVQR